MANREQVNLLKQGVDDWNTWRKKNSVVHINLYRADLSYADLSYADLRDANLNEATLINTDLSETDLSETDLSKANLINADLRGANLNNAALISSNLSHANLANADLSYADLRDADLSAAHLMNADLKGAKLNNATLISSNLINANLIGATLIGTTLIDARIGDTVFGDRDLRVVKGLETVYHSGPSPLSITTIYKSQGDIPEMFVRGCGVTDDFLNYMKALASKPIEYYTCFISYSSKDEAFVTRLYTDLQHQGVRCWFAPEDLKIGDEIQPRIDETIRLFDKLLVVLSEDSIASNWVAYEVKKARQKEPQGIPNVLYPIRIDNTILTCNMQWAQDIKATRHIGDFSHWKDHDAYQQALTRLLRDLKADHKT